MPKRMLESPTHPSEDLDDRIGGPPLSATHTAIQLHAIKALELAVSNDIVFSTEANIGNWSAKIVITKVDQLPSNFSEVHQSMSPCEADIVNLLRGYSNPLSGSDIIKKLEESSMFHGDSTVRHALAKMTNSKVLATARNGRGYILN